MSFSERLGGLDFVGCALVVLIDTRMEAEKGINQLIKLCTGHVKSVFLIRTGYGPFHCCRFRLIGGRFTGLGRFVNLNWPEALYCVTCFQGVILS